MNLYQQYLLLDRLSKITEQIGRSVYSLSAYPGDGTYAPKTAEAAVEQRWNARAAVQLTIVDADKVEASVVALLKVLTEAGIEHALRRMEGVVYMGAIIGGEPVVFYLGVGPCEKVVVGTREVPAREAYTETLYEYRCADPIVAAGLSAGAA